MLTSSSPGLSGQFQRSFTSLKRRPPIHPPGVGRGVGASGRHSPSHGSIGQAAGDIGVRGREPGPTDTVPALLTPGEGVLTRGAMGLLPRGSVEAMNALAARRNGGTLPLPGKRFRGAMKMEGGGEVRGPTVEINPHARRPLDDRLLSLLERLREASEFGDVQDATQRRGVNLGQYGQPLRLQGGGEVPGIGYVSKAQQDPVWQDIQLQAPRIDITQLKSKAAMQGIDPKTISSVLQLFGSGYGSGLSANYARAGSPTPVYGQSGYPSAIPVQGYGIGGMVGEPIEFPEANMSPQYTYAPSMEIGGAINPAYPSPPTPTPVAPIAQAGSPADLGDFGGTVGTPAPYSGIVPGYYGPTSGLNFIGSYFNPGGGGWQNATGNYGSGAYSGGLTGPAGWGLMVGGGGGGSHPIAKL